jgi:hypothetical protein
MDKIPEIEKLIENTARKMDTNCNPCSLARSSTINTCGYVGMIDMCKRRIELARTILSQEGVYVKVGFENYISVKDYLKGKKK